MKTKKTAALWASLAMLSAPAANADDLNWSGFATIAGGARTSGEDIPKGLKTAEAEGLTIYDYDDDLSIERDSHLGLQANADLGDGLTFVTQIIARGEDEWKPNIEWAYIGYQATDNLKFLFGRQRIPFFSYSDYLDVSYAYHWITPPEEMYGSVPFDSANGIGIVYSNTIGSVDSRLHFLYGRNEQDIEIGGVPVQSDINNLTSLSWTLDYEWLNFRVGYTRADIDFGYPGLDQLASGWAGLGALSGNPQWASFSDEILSSDGNNTGDFSNAALTINHNGFLFVAEYGDLGTDGTVTGDTEGMYVSTGYQFGNFLPHITYGTTEGIARDANFLNGVRAQLEAGSIPESVDPDGAGPIPAIDVREPVGQLVGGIDYAFSQATSKEKYWAVGLKWDFHPSVSFKAEYKTLINDLSDDDDTSLIRFALVSVF